MGETLLMFTKKWFGGLRWKSWSSFGPGFSPQSPEPNNKVVKHTLAGNLRC